MFGTKSLARFLFATILAMILVVIGAFLVVEATDRFSTSPGNLTSTLVCTDTQSCRLEIEISATTQDVSGLIVAETEGGVRFLPVAGRIAVDNNGHRATTLETIHIPTPDSRFLILPLVPDRSARFSGAYGVTVRMVGAMGDNTRYDDQLNIHVLVSEAGQAHILRDSSQLNAYYGTFRSGTGNLAYLVRIDPATRTQGTVYVQVNGVDNAEVALHVIDGVLFSLTDGSSARISAGMIRPDAYRILAFPFHFAPGSYTGQRSLFTGLTTGSETPWLERLPYLLQVHDGQPTGQPFITAIPAAAERVNSLPDLTPGPDITFKWDRPVGGFSGSMFDAYVTFVSGQMPMDWETFREQVLLFNPHLQQTNQTFQANRTYLLPRPETPATL